ncbi:MAG TPA: tetratricopeptide repeat protein [Lacunisphaera sp.]
MAALFVLVVLAYQPVFHAGFIWDDDAHVTAPALRSWSGLARIWTEPGATQQYYPLLHSLFWLEHRLWGDHALGYHLANLTLHALAACLFGLLLRQLLAPDPASLAAGHERRRIAGVEWIGAALFALHPVQVESVAWISEQKNTLSAVFYLGAALAWLRFDANRARKFYWIAFGLFVLGLLTKTVVATLPAALLVLGWWRRGKLQWRTDVLPLVLWFLLGATAGLFTATVERHLIGATGDSYEFSWLQRGLLAGRAVWFYLGKLAWPADLVFIYPRWTIDPVRLLTWLPLAAAIGLTGVLWTIRHRNRGPLAAWLLFAGTLFPVLGFFDVYPFLYSFVADHFSYLASLGPIALVAAGLAHVSRPIRHGLAFALLLILGVFTWRQSHIYRSAEMLYRTTLNRNPACWMAWNNLGFLQLADRTRTAEAIANFETALRLRPDYPEARGNLGLALTQAGRPTEAIPHLRESLRLKPGQYQMYNNLGIALATSGRPAEALLAFRQAAALNPTLPNIEENWAKALLLLGRREQAAEHFAIATRLRAGASQPPPE